MDIDIIRTRIINLTKRIDTISNRIKYLNNKLYNLNISLNKTQDRTRMQMEFLTKKITFLEENIMPKENNNENLLIEGQKTLEDFGVKIVK